MNTILTVLLLLGVFVIVWLSTGTKGIDRLPDWMFKVSTPDGWNPLQAFLFLVIIAPFLMAGLMANGVIK